MSYKELYLRQGQNSLWMVLKPTSAVANCTRDIVNDAPAGMETFKCCCYFAVHTVERKNFCVATNKHRGHVHEELRWERDPADPHS